MKRRVKIHRQRQRGKIYETPWIGYSYRNHNGTPDFKREISLKGLPPEEVRAISLALSGARDPLESGSDVQFIESYDVGAVWVARSLAQQLGIIDELERFEPKHREPLLAMILDRVVNSLPHSKLGLWETLPGSALKRVVCPGGTVAHLHDFYASLPRIHAAQDSIQKSLFRRHRKASRVFLYDITSSYLEGEHCPIARFGYNRDGKRGKLQIVIGLMTDFEGFPVALKVFEGNTTDQTTVLEQIDSLREQFGVEEMVFVGDRGMLTAARRRDLDDQEYSKVKYISALKRQEFLKFLDDQDHPLQPGLFDHHNLVEVSADGIRYVLSFNPEKEGEDRRTRYRLIEKTEEKLEMIKRNVDAGKWKKADVIARRLYRWLNNWSMGRFFNVEYKEGSFFYTRDQERIKAFEAIDGFYVILTDTDPEEFSTAEVRKGYKSLSQVEQAFRTMKTTGLFVRPIRHWSPEAVKGHVFVCMLAYMIVWEARRRFAEFIDHEPVNTSDETLKPTRACHSLRSLWEKLNRGVQLAVLKINGRKEVQVKPIDRDIKKILKEAKAQIGSAARRLLGAAVG